MNTIYTLILFAGTSFTNFGDFNSEKECADFARNLSNHFSVPIKSDRAESRGVMVGCFPRSQVIHKESK